MRRRRIALRRAAVPRAGDGRLRGVGGGRFNAETLEARGIQVHTAKLDVTDRASFLELRDRVHDEGGPLDVLVNNAGVAVAGPLTTMSMDDWDFENQFGETSKGAVMGMQATFGTLWGFSAKSGFGKVSDCRALRAAAAAGDRARAAAAEQSQKWYPPMLLPDPIRYSGRTDPGGGN